MRGLLRRCREGPPPVMVLQLIPVLLLCLVVRVACADVGLFSVSKLEMFVDDLPDMRKIRCYDLGKDGAPLAKSIIIGMFQKTWES